MTDPARFDATLANVLGQDPATICRLGLLFRVGDYPDKAFSLNAAEADAAVAAFTPVAADYEHTPGPLDGQLGTLTRIWRDGDALYGEATVPAWLDPLLAESGRKLSLAWDRTTKTIAGWGWVRTPRISDAALYAAFAGARHSTGDQAALNQAHDHIVAAGATNCPASPKESMMSEEPKDKKPNLWEQFVAFMTGQGMPAPDPAAFAATVPRPVAVGEITSTLTVQAPDPRIAVLEQQIQAQQAAFAQQLAKSRATEAATFAEGLVSAGRLPVYLRPWAAALYAQALADDASAAATVTFTDAAGGAQTGARADVLRALLGGLPVAQFAGAGTFTPTPGQVLNFVPGHTPDPTPDPNAPPSDARKAELHAMTPLGRDYLAAQHATGNGR